MSKLPTMLRLRTIAASGWLRGFVCTLSIWVFAAATAFAQKGKPEPEEPKGYFLQYTLMVLCLVLGVYCTARPSKRTSELRKEVEEE